MKKLFLIITLLLYVSFPLMGQPLTGKKICIDPGHGGYDPANDRFIPQTGFWESEGNWFKALHLKPMLESLGAIVILTRQGNSDADDHSLSQRAAIANQNNVDVFHSIHSNGFQGTANYTLMLFRGYDNQPVFPQAKVLGDIMADEILHVNRTTAKYNRGDWSFYPSWGTSGLGVLRPLNMPGVLSEGSFHDYIPESWRLRNSIYLKHEARSFVRSFMAYFNAGQLSHGAIAGIVRDPLHNVSYYYIPSTNDQKKPVNHVQVTLMPGNIVYNGDDRNNGFYLFDSLAPGQYTVYIEAEDYALDSAIVTVIANRTVFADKYLNEAPNYNPPTITSYQPDSASVNIGLYTPIVIDFDIRMDTTITKNAFSIQPVINGKFTWENNNKRMIFTPTPRYSSNTEYTVNISASATSLYGVAVSNPVTFSFTTRTKLNLVSAYPTSSSQKVSTTAQFIYQFDAPISMSSLSGNVLFTNEAGTNVSVFLNQSALAQGSIIFEPQSPLIANSIYKVSIKEGLKDIDQLDFGENVDYEFTTDPEVYVSGTIIDPFNAIGEWKDPDWSGSTTGTDPELTTFTIVTDRKVSGNTAGKITYVFTGNNGVCRTFNNARPNVGSSTNNKVGFWIFGDNSKNLLEYWFYYNTTTNVIVPVDTINWTGWKIVYVPLSQVTGSGDRLFHSIVIRQTPNGSKTGALYIDDKQSNIVTDIVTSTDNIDYEKFLPKEFSLEQNYPNPFNPVTNIRYTIPSNKNSLASNVTLKIYDVIGNEIATLVNETKDAGIYEVMFDASALSSGVYFYTLRSGEFLSSKKMVLLK